MTLQNKWFHIDNDKHYIHNVYTNWAKYSYADALLKDCIIFQ